MNLVRNSAIRVVLFLFIAIIIARDNSMGELAAVVVERSLRGRRGAQELREVWGAPGGSRKVVTGSHGGFVGRPEQSLGPSQTVPRIFWSLLPVNSQGHIGLFLRIYEEERPEEQLRGGLARSCELGGWVRDSGDGHLGSSQALQAFGKSKEALEGQAILLWETSRVGSPDNGGGKTMEGQKDGRRGRMGRRTMSQRGV